LYNKSGTNFAVQRPDDLLKFAMWNSNIARGGLLHHITQVQILLSCIDHNSSLSETLMNMPPEIKYPRVFLVPRCTAEQRERDHDGICDFIRDYRMKESDRQVFLEILDFFLKLAKKHGWTHFLSDGSLLGSWRHHGIIPYDYDMDLSIDIRHRAEITAIIEKETDYKIKTDARSIAHLYSESKASQHILTASSGRWKWPFIDLLYYTDNGTHLNLLSYPDMQRVKTDIFPLHDRPFEVFDIPSPRDSLKYLQSEYGESDRCRAIGDINYKCEQLKDVIPFVHREFKNDVMIETLKSGDKVIHVKQVREEEVNLPKSPYTLETAVSKNVHMFSPDMIDAMLTLNQPIQKGD
jgi:hypothetical protein